MRTFPVSVYLIPCDIITLFFSCDHISLDVFSYRNRLMFRSRVYFSLETLGPFLALSRDPSLKVLCVASTSLSVYRMLSVHEAILVYWASGVLQAQVSSFVASLTWTQVLIQ